jgi:hypothetical protein
MIVGLKSLGDRLVSAIALAAANGCGGFDMYATAAWLYVAQPIGDAPRDGTRVHAWPCRLADGPRVVEAYWYSHPSVSGWVTDALDCGDYEFEPTHWVPKDALGLQEARG